METVPGYVSTVFILTTFASVAFLLQAIKQAGLQTLPARILVFLLPLWIFFQAILAIGGFYQRTTDVMPWTPLAGTLPTVLLIAAYFAFFRKDFLAKLPLSLLTLLHTVRIPVELVLYWLSLAGAVPQVMTFDGRNFDILSGILSPFIYIFAVRKTNRLLLIIFNLIGLALLINIISIAIAALPTAVPAEVVPNRAVLYFPYVWLPTIIVPIVLFSHLIALWRLFRPKSVD